MRFSSLKWMWSAFHLSEMALWEQAPGRLCDFWPTESVWSWVKRRLTKKVSKSRAFKKGKAWVRSSGQTNRSHTYQCKSQTPGVI